MKKEDNPCYQCPDRKAMCHIGCKREKEYTEKRRLETEKIKAAKREDMLIKKYKMEKGHRIRKDR